MAHIWVSGSGPTTECDSCGFYIDGRGHLVNDAVLCNDCYDGVEEERALLDNEDREFEGGGLITWLALGAVLAALAMGMLFLAAMPW